MKITGNFYFGRVRKLLLYLRCWGTFQREHLSDDICHTLGVKPHFHAGVKGAVYIIR